MNYKLGQEDAWINEQEMGASKSSAKPASAAGKKTKRAMIEISAKASKKDWMDAAEARETKGKGTRAISSRAATNDTNFHKALKCSVEN